MVTVAHAVAGEQDITVTAPDGRTLPAAVAAIDPDLDAAVLRVDGLDLPALPRRTFDGEADGAASMIRVEDGRATSVPVTIRRRVTINTTDIYREGEHQRPGFELGADVTAGDSGSGVVASDGSLVGVVWAASREAERSRVGAPHRGLRAADRGRASRDRARCHPLRPLTALTVRPRVRWRGRPRPCRRTRSPR